MNKIKVMTKRPGARPVLTWISDSEENIRRYLRDEPRILRLLSDIAVVCGANSDDKEVSFRLSSIEFRGELIIAGYKDGELCDLPTDYKGMKQCFPQLWEDIK